MNLIDFIITTIVAYVVSALVTMTTETMPLYTYNRRQEITTPVVIPFEYSYPIAMPVVMSAIPVLFYVSTVLG